MPDRCYRLQKFTVFHVAGSGAEKLFY